MGEGVRGEAHWVVAGELDDALVGVDCTADDVAARVIGQSAEQAIEVYEGGRGDLHSTTIWLYCCRVKGRMSRSNANHGNLHAAPGEAYST